MSLGGDIPPLPESDPKAGQKVQPTLRRRRSPNKDVVAGRRESLEIGQR